jgi:hypothetical protein
MAAATIEEYITGLDEPLTAVAVTLKEHLDATLSGSTGQMWHGHPVWMSDGNPIAGFKAYPDYVTFMLWRGQEIDTAGTLSPAGSGSMSTLKVSKAAELHGPDLRRWLSQAANL